MVTFTDVESFLPDYFVGSQGEKTMAELRIILERMVTEKWCKSKQFEDELSPFMPLFSVSRRFGHCAEALGFMRLIRSPQLEEIKFAKVEFNFERGEDGLRAYVEPTVRYKFACLVLGLYVSGQCVALRVFQVHMNGQIRSIQDLGVTDAFFMPNNVQYQNLKRTFKLL